ncbi:MAG: hypothetical protein M3Y91_10305, partial [Actinomycetota bacterium]|nr:hypothetical protein [Actinomycetota bacterium]
MNGEAARRVTVAAVAARVGQLLHRADVAATPERSGRFAAALTLARPVTPAELYWLGRVTLLTDRDQVPVWDRVFAQIFGGLVDEAEFRGQAGAARLEAIPQAIQPRPGRTPPDRTTADGEAVTAPPMPGGDGAADREGERDTVMVAMSADERLRTQDFATLSPDELLALRALMRNLVLATPPRRSRRRVRSRRGSQVDLR